MEEDSLVGITAPRGNRTTTSLCRRTETFANNHFPLSINKDPLMLYTDYIALSNHTNRNLLLHLQSLLPTFTPPNMDKQPNTNTFLELTMRQARQNVLARTSLPSRSCPERNPTQHPEEFLAKRILKSTLQAEMMIEDAKKQLNKTK